MQSWFLVARSLVIELMTRSQYLSLQSDLSRRFYPRDAMLARVIAIATCPSIDTKIDDLGWPWTAVSSNFSKFQTNSPDGAGDVCCNLSYRPIIGLFLCFDKKNKYN